MRKYILSVVAVVLSVGVFAQTQVELNKQKYNDDYFYQGELALPSYSEDPENGFLPGSGMVVRITYSGFGSSVALNEFKVNLVDRSAIASYWMELGSEYVLLA